MKTVWKVGDKFIIDGPDDELKSYCLISKKGTVQEIADFISDTQVRFFEPDKDHGGIFSWHVKIQHMKPLTKLHKALM